MFRYTFSLLVALSLSSIALGQQPQVAGYGQEQITLDIPSIPSLEELIDSALYYAPMRQYHLERALESESRIKLARRDWMQYVGLESYYRYGQLGILDVTTPGGSSTPIVTNNSSNQTQNWWYIGAYIRIPLSGITQRSPEIQRLRHTVQQSRYEMDDAAQLITLKVIDLYNDLMLNLDLLRIKTALFETNNAQVKEAENQYLRNKIDLPRLSQLMEMQAKVASEYSTARYTCRSSIIMLETLTGIRITHGSSLTDFNLVRTQPKSITK